MVVGENKKAVIWSGINKVSSYVVNFAIQIILARLLCPEDYAVVAVLGVFFAISQSFIDSGFPTTLIQRQDCTQKDFSTVFYFNLLIGGIIYGIFFFTAPYIENFFNIANLSIVTRVYSLNLLISALLHVNRVILVKSLRFKQIAIIGFTSSVISSIPAIILAYLGWGYWALVNQVLLGSVFSSIMMFYYSKWKPSLVFSIVSLKKLAPFGLRVLVVHLFHAVYNNIYSLLIGKKYLPAELGYYDRGKTLSSMGPVGFSDSFMSALYPIQAKIQNDNNALRHSYNRAFALSCYLIVPISMYMFNFSNELIYTLFGPKWMDAAWILSVLCIGYMFYPMQSLNINILKVKGRGDSFLYSEVLKKTIGIIIVLVAINFDLKIVIYGWVLGTVLEYIISQVYCFHICKFPIRDVMRPFAYIVFLTFILSKTIYAMVNFMTNDTIAVFFISGVLYAVTYVMCVYKKIILAIKK